MSKRKSSANGACVTCPHCQNKINTVYVYSNCHQKAWIDADGRIVEYGQPELEEMTDIGCSQCLKSLKEVIHE